MKTLVAFVLLAAPAAFAADSAGHYVLEGVHEVGSELMLNPDGTFEYMLAYGAADYSAAGTWKRNGDSVILNSAIKDGPPFRMIRGGTVKSLDTRVWVKAPNGQPVEHIEVALQTPGGEVTEQTDNQGAATFPGVRSADGVKMRVRVYHVEAGPFQLDSKQNLDMLAVAVSSLDNLDGLAPTLRALGQRQYGVLPEHYGTLKTALLWALGQTLPGSVAPDTKAAWRAVIEAISSYMMDCASELPPKM